MPIYVFAKTLDILKKLSNNKNIILDNIKNIYKHNLLTISCNSLYFWKYVIYIEPILFKYNI